MYIFIHLYFIGLYLIFIHFKFLSETSSQGESSDKVDNSVKVFFMIDSYSLKGA